MHSARSHGVDPLPTVGLGRFGVARRRPMGILALHRGGPSGGGRVALFGGREVRFDLALVVVFVLVLVRGGFAGDGAPHVAGGGGGTHELIVGRQWSVCNCMNGTRIVGVV